MIDMRARRPQGSPLIVLPSPASTMTTTRLARPFLVEAGVDVWLGGNPCGRLALYVITTSASSTTGRGIRSYAHPAFPTSPVHRLRGRRMAPGASRAANVREPGAVPALAPQRCRRSHCACSRADLARVLFLSQNSESPRLALVHIYGRAALRLRCYCSSLS